MVTINLHQPGKIDVTLQFPSEWNELMPKEVLEISKQLFINQDWEKAARGTILRFILENRIKKTVKHKERKKFPSKWTGLLSIDDAVIQGYPLLDFIWTKNNLTTITEKKIWLPGFPPAPVYGLGDFQKITCGEFEDAQMFFVEYYEDPDLLCLANLAAIIWREKNLPYMTYNRKLRNYKTYNYKKKVRRFIRLSPERLYSIFIWWAGCQSMLPNIFPTVYESNAEPTANHDKMAFTKCIHSGAGPRNGTRIDIRRMKLTEYMYDMEQEAIKAKEIREEYERNKK